MKIDSIKRGIVIDHIHAGRSMDIYKYLHLDELECSVAIIKNVKSDAMGRKDIIKIDDVIDLDLDAIGYIDPEVTINIIEDGAIVEKINEAANIISELQSALAAAERVFELMDEPSRAKRS